MTIYDIAEIAGVSASTVSRVINNKPGVSAKMRQKIFRLMEEHHYSPNAIARGLVNRSSKTIGILVEDIRNIHHTDGAYHIEKELISNGYCCIILNTGDENAGKENAIEILSRRRVEGIVMMGSTFQCEAVETAIKKCFLDIPVVLVNGWFDLPNVYGVLSDEQGGIKGCVEHLIAKGKTQIAFICGKVRTFSNILKENGYCSGVSALHMNGQPRIYHTESSLEGGYSATRQLLDAYPETDGIVYGEDILAAGGLKALYEKKIMVPEQVAVTGVNNSIYAQLCSPALTSLDNKHVDASIMAARLIMDSIAGKRNTSRIMLIPELVIRETT